MTRIKICGITRLEDARFCAAAGADYLGFIQYDKSPRYVEPGTAKQIIDWVYGPEPVGVFVNAGADEVNQRADEAGFRLVQLHGDESPEVCAAIERPVIKAVRVKADSHPDQLLEHLRRYEGAADYFLLDTHSDEVWGGTGSRFDWDLARYLVGKFKIFLAGGVGASNIQQAVSSVQPFAVDLSSSIESEPGKKDFDRLTALFEVYDALRARV